MGFPPRKRTTATAELTLNLELRSFTTACMELGLRPVPRNIRRKSERRRRCPKCVAVRRDREPSLAAARPSGPGVREVYECGFLPGKLGSGLSMDKDNYP